MRGALRRRCAPHVPQAQQLLGQGSASTHLTVPGHLWKPGGLEIARNAVLVQLALQPWWSKAFLPGKIFLVKGVLWLKYEEGWKQSLQGEKYGYCARIDRGNLHVSELFFTQNIPAS